jgi:hypothetical protein
MVFEHSISGDYLDLSRRKHTEAREKGKMRKSIIIVQQILN